MRHLAVFLSLVLFGSLGCTSRREGATPDDDAGGGGVDASPQRPDVGPLPDTGPRLDDVLIYAHSADTLFTFSAYTNTVVTIGEFRLPDGSAPPNMLDLAVNAAGDVYTTSNRELYRVDPETAVVSLVGEYALGSERLFALSFLVPGELGPGEALVGATNEGVYYELNPVTAAARRLGEYPDGWLSSGDIVSIEGLGNYATLRRDDFPDSDQLARISFDADGSSSVEVVGPVGFRQIFGLGYWGRNVYGFTNAGELVRIDRTTGAGELATAETGTDQFWGAGVTTQAPVLF